VARNKRSLIAVAAAVVLAAAGSTAILLYVGAADRRAVQGRAPVSVLVATKRVPAGTTGADLRAGGYVEAVTMPASTVPGDALRSVDGALDVLVLTADLQPRQLVLRGAFGDRSGLAGGVAIPSGKIAVTVDVAGMPAGSMVRAGSIVAVFDTYTPRDATSRVPSGLKGPQPAADADHVTRLLMPKVQVLAVGATTGAAGADTTQATAGQLAVAEKAASGLTAVTFAASQEEAEKLILAASTTQIYVALLDDSSDLRPGPGTDTRSLFP
jgi:pilus assembly protein CpaB